MLGRICNTVSSFCGNAINRIPKAVRQFSRETAAEAAAIAFGAVAAKISEVTFCGSMVANGAGAFVGVFHGTERARTPSLRISSARAATGLLISTATAAVSANACLRGFEWKKMNYAKGLFVVFNFITTAQLTALAVPVDGFHPGSTEEEINPLQKKRAIEWGAGAACGTCVAGYVAVPFGVGVVGGIAAGVVAMKATRAVVRALTN